MVCTSTAQRVRLKGECDLSPRAGDVLGAHTRSSCQRRCCFEGREEKEERDVGGF